MRPYNIIKLFFIVALFTTTTQAAFEVDPQTRIKLSVNGALAKSFVLSHDEIPLAGKSLNAGFGIAGEYPLWKNLAAGLSGKFLFELARKAPTYIDIDAFPKFQFDLTEGAIASNLYISAPVGVSLVCWKDQLKNTGLGFNVGLFLGSHFYFAEHFGFYSEIGYTYRNASIEFAQNNPTKNLHINELAANLGLSYGF